MFCRFVLFFVVFLTATLFGCGAEKEDILLGEEVVVEKWIDPTDIGKEYLLEDEILEVGDTVFLSTGKRYTITESDAVEMKEQGIFVFTLTNMRPSSKNPGVLIYDAKIPRGYVVPEGPPIVSLYSEDLFLQEGIFDVGPDRLKDRPIRKHNNVQQWESATYISYWIGIDRVLDHHLLVYVEYQTLNRPEDGGEVARGRQLLLIPKGETLVRGGSLPPNYIYRYYDKISVRVLPHTDMSNIELPVEVDNFDSGDDDLSKKDLTVIAGHTFRSYRIASSSFYMGQEIPTKSDW